MEDFIANNFEHYGPWAVFFLLMLTGVGIPLGEDLIVIPAGTFVGLGQMGFWATYLAAFAGVTLSDCLWYGVCSRYGTRLLHMRGFKRLVHPRRLLEVKHQMDRRGAGMVFMARFIPGSRTTAITVSGMLHMPFWRFAAATAVGVVISAPIQIGIGVLSVHIAGVEEPAHLIRMIVGLMLLSIMVMLMLGAWRRHRRRPHRPRAKARWLKKFRIKHDQPTGHGPTNGALARAPEPEQEPRSTRPADVKASREQRAESVEADVR